MKKKRVVEITGREEYMVLHDYGVPKAIGVDSSIMEPSIEAHDFELNPALVTFMERDQFTGTLQRTSICSFATSLQSATQLS